MSNGFKDFGIDEKIVARLEELSIVNPTAVQRECYEKIKAGRDVIATSGTGTGKTLAYLLPLFSKIDPEDKNLTTIILAPTHELAIQIQREIDNFTPVTGIRSVPLIGGANIKRQIEKLKTRPHIVVGSTGRIEELLNQKKLKQGHIRYLIVDEADRLLDENNLEDTEKMLNRFPNRQTIMVSATMPEVQLRRAEKLVKEPEKITVEIEKVSSQIAHFYTVCEQRDKIVLLRKLAHALPEERLLVFLNKNEEIELTYDKLTFHKLKVGNIHGMRKKTDRRDIIHNFKKGKSQLLLTSDITSRGLHFDSVNWVINMDMPERSDTYVHRAGRTGRMGRTGTCFSIVTERELTLLKQHAKKLGIDLEKKKIYKGKII